MMLYVLNAYVQFHTNTSTVIHLLKCMCHTFYFVLYVNVKIKKVEAYFQSKLITLGMDKWEQM